MTASFHIVIPATLEALDCGALMGLFPAVQLVLLPANAARLEPGHHEAERLDELAHDQFTAHLAVRLAPDRARQGRGDPWTVPFSPCWFSTSQRMRRMKFIF